MTLGQVCASVAYHYHLTPDQVAQFSGPQLLLWYEAASAEVGFSKLLELDISLVPHTEKPDEALHHLRDHLVKMTKHHK